MSFLLDTNIISNLTRPLPSDAQIGKFTSKPRYKFGNMFAGLAGQFDRRKYSLTFHFASDFSRC